MAVERSEYLDDRKRFWAYARGEKSHQELFRKLKTASHLSENSAFKPQLTALITHCEHIDRIQGRENGALTVIDALLLIEDVLDKKLTHEDFKQRITWMSSEASPFFAKLSLLLGAFGVALVVTGFFMIPGGVPLVAAGALAQATVVSGLLCSIAGGVGFFRYNPSQMSTLSEDFGKACYNATLSNG